MDRKLLWVLVLFAAITYPLSAGLYLVQIKLHLRFWVFTLASFGPFCGALVTWLIGRRLGWPVKLTVRQGFSPPLLRRWLVNAVIGAAIVLLAVQAYTFLTWPLKPRRLESMTHPLALPKDQSTLVLLVSLGFVVGLLLEEFAWRVFLQPTLRRHFSTLLTAAIVAVAWAGWQIPQFASGLLGRHAKHPSLLPLAFFLVSYLLALYAQSLILMLSLQRMTRGQWVAALVFRFVVAFGFWLILDEETGRWQAMAVIAIASVVGALAAYYYWNRRAMDPRRRRVSIGKEKALS